MLQRVDMKGESRGAYPGRLTPRLHLIGLWEPMAERITHNQLREELHGAGEHAKRFIDHVIKAACLFLEDHQAEAGAVEVSTPAQGDKSVLTLAELATRLGRDPKTISKWVDDFGLPELRADADKSEPLYYWPEVLEWMHRHQKNGKMSSAPSNGTRPQAKLR
jgi:hypothetical protein